MNFVVNVSIQWILASGCIGLVILSIILILKIHQVKKNSVRGVQISDELSYDHLMELFDNVLFGMVVFTYNSKQEQFIIAHVNSTVERVDQINRKMIIGTPLSNIYPYYFHKDLMDRCHEVWETGISSHSEIFIPMYNHGKERYRDYYIYKLTSGHVVSVFRDITHRRRIEKALQEGQQKWKDTYHRLNQLMPDGLISCNLDGHIIETNVSFQKMVGYSEKELLNMTHKDITEKEWHEFENQFIPKQLDINGFSDVYHKQYVRKDHTSFKAEIQTYLIKDEKDQPVSTWSIVRDVTDQEKNITSLKESRVYIENILSSMLDALIVINMDLTIKKANKALYKLTGFDEYDLLGKSISILIKSIDEKDNSHEKIDHIWMHGLFSRITKNKSITNYEMILNCKKNDPIAVKFFCSIMMDYKNDSIGFVGIIRDIRDDKIKNEQMIQAERYAALGEVIPGVGHELSQPLNVIKIINQSLLRDIEKNRFHLEDLQQDLNSVIDEVNKMSEIIDHMRLFARSSRQMEKAFVDMNTIIHSALRFFSQQLKNRTIEAKISIDSNLPMIKADPARMEQMIVNLITNARDSLERADISQKVIQINCYVWMDETESQFIVIEVIDNGKGLPDKLAKYIFDQHFIPGTPWDGTGMGIAIAKKIIEEHEGKIAMQNMIGKGTTFTIHLPVSH